MPLLPPSSESYFRSLVENANDVLFVLTREGFFHYLSPQWTEAFGYALQESLGRPFMPFVHPDDVASCAAFLQKAYATGEKQSGVEYRVKCKDGRYLWYRANASLVKDPETGELMLVGIGRDITEIKRAETDLLAAKLAAEYASHSKTRFLAAASHDLRQPVQAIGLFIDALDQTPLSDEQKRITRFLKESAQSLGDLLSILLDVSKLDSGIIRPEPAALPVDTLFDRIEAKFSPLATERSLKFRLRFPPGKMAVFTDGKLLMSLLGNLIVNAIKYTAKGGILVGVRRRGDQALIQVWDTGIGIDADHLGNIFDEYFQIGNSERDVSKGLGLGLSIAKRIAGLLGTEIRCRSRPGRGSLFEFRLPFAGSAQTIEPAEATARQADIGIDGRRFAFRVKSPAKAAH